jgi:hypothetical protein
MRCQSCHRNKNKTLRKESLNEKKKIIFEHKTSHSNVYEDEAMYIKMQINPRNAEAHNIKGDPPYTRLSLRRHQIHTLERLRKTSEKYKRKRINTRKKKLIDTFVPAKHISDDSDRQQIIKRR